MSRRPPNPAAEKQARNQVTLKSLLKLEPNKMCADCKRNKHPRWASWNLGVFICIRCSGIHRSMGVHISRVKSVDLDSWTDEQMQSILSWGNARANKYWEDKLAPGHTPSEAKIENFIRTKYELKRWVMDGPMPDPASLDADGDDDVPLSLVKEKQTIERKESLRRSGGQSASPTPQPQAATFDLIGGDDPIPRASTAGPVSTNVPPKAAPAPPKATPANSSSLLGLDFLGSEPAPPSRPASTTGFGGASAGTSRPDLKQSILSLYATAPRPQQAQQPSHSHSNSFGSMHSPTAPAAPQQQQQSSLNDAFSNLSFANISNKSPSTSSPSAFSSLGGMSSSKSPPPQSSSAFSGLSGGSFFDTKPAAPSPKPAQSNFGGFGDFNAPAKPAAAPASSSAMNDLFDFSASSSSPAPAPAVTTTSSSSVFNLSQPKPSPAPAATTTPSIPLASLGGGSDVWGGNAWADPAPPAKAPTPQPAMQASSNDFGGWGSMGGGSLANASIVPGASGGLVTQPKVSADEEFGGWTSSTGAATTGSGGGKGVGGSEDLFSNVWE
ncbi:ARF GAP with effector function(s) [Gnomoniopsis smithogilvyi]|uniref:ARF GAP with effector function(S) n=1 Tax=Gnomoniopsis smithogilvyi TaxID=1191159 RepID=A0A9W9CXG2_9PEZI|nr:ARF GAP with effector function(s) [Gnomoniopsis smithogilvyi]